ncbi:MAG: hypothetical protein HYV95_03650 [Opitutae bacterium]|nr:hypothetical protein [Opitutae bacterium]
MLIQFKRAPVGYEDERGFHYGIESLSPALRRTILGQSPIQISDKRHTPSETPLPCSAKPNEHDVFESGAPKV